MWLHVYDYPLRTYLYFEEIYYLGHFKDLQSSLLQWPPFFEEISSFRRNFFLLKNINTMYDKFSIIRSIETQKSFNSLLHIQRVINIILHYSFQFHIISSTQWNLLRLLQQVPPRLISPMLHRESPLLLFSWFHCSALFTVILM